jgi:hypothetical protein
MLVPDRLARGLGHLLVIYLIVERLNMATTRFPHGGER